MTKPGGGRGGGLEHAGRPPRQSVFECDAGARAPEVGFCAAEYDERHTLRIETPDVAPHADALPEHDREAAAHVGAEGALRREDLKRVVRSVRLDQSDATDEVWLDGAERKRQGHARHDREARG